MGGDLVRLGRGNGEEEGVLLGPDPRSEWEGLCAGSCVGERRMLLLSPSMAFGEAGIFHKIPSNAPLELMVEVLEIKRPSGSPEQPRSSPTLPVPVDGDPVLEFLRQGSTGNLFTFGNLEEEEEEK